MKILPRAIKTKVNQFAHRRALHHELIVREATMRELQILAEGGVSIPDLYAALQRLEAAADAQPHRGSQLSGSEQP